MRTSGLQYSMVPQNVPNTLPGRRNAAEPKSITFTWKVSSRMIFSSLMSLCKILRLCRYETAATNWKYSRVNMERLVIQCYCSYKWKTLICLLKLCYFLTTVQQSVFILEVTTHLSENIRCQSFVQIGASVNKLKQIHSASMLLHNHLVKLVVFKTLHQL